MSNLTETTIDQTIEAALFAYGEPLSAVKLQQLFPADEKLTIDIIKAALERIKQFYEGRGVELVQVASGWRFQAVAATAPLLQKLWDKKPKRYSRAVLETLVLIAYRQPITRGEIEEVRGVAVNAQIIKSLLEREWIEVVGTRNIPGKPALFRTTKAFLDYFELTKLSDLPPLEEIHSPDQLSERLAEQLSLLAVGENLTNDDENSSDSEIKNEGYEEPLTESNQVKEELAQPQAESTDSSDESKSVNNNVKAEADQLSSVEEQI